MSTDEDAGALDSLSPSSAELASVLVSSTPLTVDEDFLYDPKAHHSIVAARPWDHAPKYFNTVKVSALALLKMLVHARAGGKMEIMGSLLGKVYHHTIVVIDITPLPVEGTETRVNAQDDAYEYLTMFKESVSLVGRTENVVGWYHSHPSYGCWLSGIDVSTQRENQKHQDPFLAIVVDPITTISSGKVSIGAFRTFPAGYQPPEEPSSEYQTIPLDKVEDFGVHAKEYYSLDISIFKSTLDKHLIDLLWKKYWVNTLSSVTILAQPDYLAGLTKVLATKAEFALDSISRVHYSRDSLEDRLAKCSKDATKMATEQLHALMMQFTKRQLFSTPPSE